MSGADYLVPTFIVKINDDRISQEMTAEVMSLVVEEQWDAPTRFTLLLSDRALTWVDESSLDEGSTIKIEMGYLNEVEEIFDGEITGLQMDFPQDGSVSLAVRGYDRLHRLARGKKTRTFKDKTDKQIAEDIAGDASLQVEGDSTEDSREYVLQKAQTDLEFLQERAERLGFEVGVKGTQLLFGKPKVEDSSVATLEWGKTLLDLNIDLSAIGQVSKVEVRGWDPEKQTVVTGKADKDSQSAKMGGDNLGSKVAEDAFGESVRILSDSTVLSESEAENIAKAVFRDSCLEYVKAEGRCVGNPKVRSGKIISFKTVGDKFTGDYFVVNTRHELSRDGYITHFKAKRNAR